MSCPFCFPGEGEEVFGNELCYSIYDRFPVSPGHMLILPRRHVVSYFDADDEEKKALWAMVDEARAMLDGRFRPDGYNIGINVGEAAGQTVMHLHIHVIPRYIGDVERPRGGVRGVIPTKMSY